MHQHFNRDYLLRLPLPLAQLYSRAHSDEDMRGRHDNSYYLFEALVKLAVAPLVAVAAEEARAGTPLPVSLARSLAELSSPSFGQWVELLRELARHFGSRPDSHSHRLGKVWQHLDAPRSDLPGVLALYRRIANGPDGEPGGKQKCSLLRLFEVLVRYRNRALGHSAVRPLSFYQELAPLLFAAANDVLANGVLDLLGPPGARLACVTEVRTVTASDAEVSLRELTGLRPVRLSPLVLPRERTAGLFPSRVCLLQSESEQPLPLDPVLAYRQVGDREDVLFLNGNWDGRQAEYLNYATGTTEALPGLEPSLRPLFDLVGGPRHTPPVPGKVTAAVGASREVVPPLPQPFFAHPYPLQENFTGRVSERRVLTEWLTRGRRPVLTLVAFGGMGKSALAWVWLRRDVLGLPGAGDSPAGGKGTRARRVPKGRGLCGVLWWSFYEPQSSFPVFVDQALAYCGGAASRSLTLADKVAALLMLLQQQRFLLVLDGFERELRDSEGATADRPTERGTGDEYRQIVDPHAARFLRQAASLPLRGRILLTSRLFPRELDGLDGCQRHDLTGLAPEDAFAFYRAQGVRGTRSEIQATCEPYGYHPLALRLLAGLIVHDPARPGDPRAAAEYDPLPNLVPRERHVLALAFDALAPTSRELLGRLAACRSPASFAVVKALIPDGRDMDLKAALLELRERGLLFFDPSQARYDLHPLVRQYAYQRLADKEAVHALLAEFFCQPLDAGEDILMAEGMLPPPSLADLVSRETCPVIALERPRRVVAPLCSDPPPSVFRNCDLCETDRRFEHVDDVPLAVAACPHASAHRTELVLPVWRGKGLLVAACARGDEPGHDGRGSRIGEEPGEAGAPPGFLALWDRRQSEAFNRQIEAFHHTARAGRYDEAFTRLRDQLGDELYFRLGAYLTYADLLRELFPDGESRRPRLSSPRNQSWAANALATTYVQTGQPRLAVPLLQLCNRIDEEQGDRFNHAVGLGNLAVSLLKLGKLAAAEQSLRKAIALCAGTRQAFDVAVLHAELGRVLAYQARFEESSAHLDTSACLFDNPREPTPGAEPASTGCPLQDTSPLLLIDLGACVPCDECVRPRGPVEAEPAGAFRFQPPLPTGIPVGRPAETKGHERGLKLRPPHVDVFVGAYRALRHLLSGDAETALGYARRAHAAATRRWNEHDCVRAAWLLGWALTEASSGRADPSPLREEAAVHLADALARLRRIHLVDYEADVLLAWARWHRQAGSAGEARRQAEEALLVADRCEYRLKQAEIHLFLALLCADEGALVGARSHAAAASERAWCDGPAACYHPVLAEAKRLLADSIPALPR
jgi:tetratricopeptide (TPR) repeat protein